MRTIVITGASDGIGAAASRQPVARGRRVVLVGRSPKKTRAVAAELGAPYHPTVFSDLGAGRGAARRVLADRRAREQRGWVFGKRQLTGDGFEHTFQVNHLGPFLLTNLLRERLVESEASIIQTASAAARLFSRFDVTDLNAARRYSGWRAYGNAKLANILFTRELQRRWGSDGVSAVAFHPGVVATNFAGNTGRCAAVDVPQRPRAPRADDEGGGWQAPRIPRRRHPARELAAWRLLREQPRHGDAPTCDRPVPRAGALGAQRQMVQLG